MKSNQKCLQAILVVTGICLTLFSGINSASPAQPVLVAQSDDQNSMIMTGELTLDSPVMEDDGSYYETHTFTGTAGETITVDLISNDFDTYLILISPTGERLAQNNDRAGDSNSQITLTLPVTGVYDVIVNSYVANEIGAYQLQWRTATTLERELAQASQLHEQAIELEQAGRYEEAILLAERALKIIEEQLGSEHPNTAFSFHNLASLYASMGRYEEAEPYFRQALLSYEERLGSEHPDTATSLHNLARLYALMGRFGEAEPLMQQALKIREQQLGSNHIDTAGSLTSLSILYLDIGRYEEAISLAERALAIMEEQLGPEHLSVASALHNLAGVYQTIGQYDEAEPLFQRSLEIREQQLGPEHPDTASSLHTLGFLYGLMKRYDEAEPLLKRVLLIREQQLGINHPYTASIVNNIAWLYDAMERYEEAKPLYERALKIREQQLSPDHPDLANSLNNLAGWYYAQGETESTLNYLARGIELEEEVLSRNLISGSDTEKRNYLTKVAGTTDGVISLHLNDLQFNTEAAQLALTTLLQRKGRVLDLFTNLRAQLAGDATALKILEDLNTVNTQLSTLTFVPTSEQTEEFRSQLSELQASAHDLEDKLSRQSATFAELTTSPALTEIQAALPSSAALVEFIRYQPFNPTGSSAQERYGDYHYAVYVMYPDGTVQGTDLGNGAEIDTLVADFNEALRNYRLGIDQLEEASKALESVILAPIRELLTGFDHLLISPDGSLNLIPFEALMDSNGKYLVSQFTTTYLTSGRDLLRLQTPSEPEQPPLLVADPTFPAFEPTTPDAVAFSTRQIQDFEKMNFSPLPGTALEAKAIQSILPQSQLLSGAQATESAIKQSYRPSILHIATHGLFFESDSDETVPINNPLLRSGLVLSEVNQDQGSDTAEDGVLTALEVSGLDLSGTQMVVLSACDTGQGDITVGEGVYGLRRALVLAGSHSQVISLWQVQDDTTKDLMVGYYERLLQGEGRSEALRNTRLDMLKNTATEHPYYWAPFIQSGDWRPLGVEFPDT